MSNPILEHNRLIDAIADFLRKSGGVPLPVLRKEVELSELLVAPNETVAQSQLDRIKAMPRGELLAKLVSNKWRAAQKGLLVLGTITGRYPAPVAEPNPDHLATVPEVERVVSRHGMAYVVWTGNNPPHPLISSVSELDGDEADDVINDDPTLEQVIYFASREAGDIERGAVVSTPKAIAHKERLNNLVRRWRRGEVKSIKDCRRVWADSGKTVPDGGTGETPGPSGDAGVEGTGQRGE